MRMVSVLTAHCSPLTATLALLLGASAVGCIERYDHFWQGMDGGGKDGGRDGTVTDSRGGEGKVDGRGPDNVHPDLGPSDLEVQDSVFPADTDGIDLPDVLPDVKDAVDTEAVDVQDAADEEEVLSVPCGDGVCSAGFETCATCPTDCGCTDCGEECVAGECIFTACGGKECGDDGCGGTCGSCPSGKSCQAGKCVVKCGDGQCGAGEDKCSCAADCTGGCAGCCQGGVCKQGTSDSECGQNGGACAACTGGKTCQSQACAYKCGDGVCASIAPGTETCCTCPGDCGSCCGNGSCDCGENGQTCPGDCGAVTAGFVKVNKGSFWMGSPSGCPGPAGYTGDCTSEPGRFSNETLHYVKLTHDFEMQVYEVTQGEWKAAFGGWNPASSTKGDGYPIETVSWYDSCAYANWKSEQGGLTPCYVFSGVKCEDGLDVGSKYKGCLNGTQKGIDSGTVTLAGGVGKPYACQGYRLPTEAEWEYAARAGTLTAYHDGKPSDSGHLGCEVPFHLTDIAWYCGNNTPSGTKTVGGKGANNWGLKDMSGNVWEWCWDKYCSDNTGYGDDPDASSCGGSYRVLRGGSWHNDAVSCRSAVRDYHSPGDRGSYLGCRLARSL